MRESKRSRTAGAGPSFQRAQGGTRAALLLRIRALEEKVEVLERHLALGTKPEPPRPPPVPKSPEGPRCPGCRLRVETCQKGRCPWCGFHFDAVG